MKTIPFLFLVAASMSCFAQNKEPKNELGLNLYGLEIDVDYLGDGMQDAYYFNGLQYKRQLSNHYKLRVSGQYFTIMEKGSMDFSSSPDGGVYSWNYTTSVYEARGGLERIFMSSKKINPFVFADIAYRQSNNKGSSWGSSWMGQTTNDINRTAHYVGAMFGIGVRYSPITPLYIGFESSICAYGELSKGYGDGSVTMFSPIKTLVFGVRF